MWFIYTFRLSVALEDPQEIGDGEYTLMDNISTRSAGLFFLCWSFSGLTRRIKDSRTKMITMILRRSMWPVGKWQVGYTGWVGDVWVFGSCTVWTPRQVSSGGTNSRLQVMRRRASRSDGEHQLAWGRSQSCKYPREYTHFSKYFWITVDNQRSSTGFWSDSAMYTSGDPSAVWGNSYELHLLPRSCKKWLVMQDTGLTTWHERLLAITFIEGTS